MERLFIQPGVNCLTFIKTEHVETGSGLVKEKSPQLLSDLELERHKALCSQEIPDDEVGRLVSSAELKDPNGWGDQFSDLTPKQKSNAWRFFLYGALKKLEERGMPIEEIKNHLKTYAEASEKEKTGQEGK